MRTSKLGTSLENLLSKRKPTKAKHPDGLPPDDEILHIPVADIKPSPSQPRTAFGEESFVAELPPERAQILQDLGWVGDPSDDPVPIG